VGQQHRIGCDAEAAPDGRAVDRPRVGHSEPDPHHRHPGEVVLDLPRRPPRVHDHHRGPVEKGTPGREQEGVTPPGDTEGARPGERIRFGMGPVQEGAEAVRPTPSEGRLHQQVVEHGVVQDHHCPRLA
jgi:hypothetical protein